jgi:hypothetical protein
LRDDCVTEMFKLDRNVTSNVFATAVVERSQKRQL